MFSGDILKLKRFDRSSDAVRIKAILVAGFTLVAVLIADLLLLYRLGLRWDYAALIGTSLFLVVALTFSYRFHRKFYIAGLGFTLILAGMVYLGASISNIGIESALLPFLPLTIILAGIISGWRMTLLTAFIAIGVMCALFMQTAGNTNDGTLAAALGTPLFVNKAIQLGLSCMMATIMAASLSLSMHGLFKRDELSIEKIQQAERQRTAFLSSLSHEIRTPLNGIVGMTSLLKHTDLTPQQKQYSDIVASCSDKLLDVMGTVMEFSQINNERIVLAPEAFDIHALAHELVKRYADRLPDKSDVILGLHIAQQVPQHIFADPKRIELVLNHLLRNAVNFTPKGSINLLMNGAVSTPGNFRLCVYVRDTGVGIRQKDLKYLYTPFHQLDNRLNREHEGTGLGLSLCKEIIEFMNGKIDVISEFGTGSTFYFEIEVPTQDYSQVDNKKILDKLAAAEDLSNIAVFKKAI